MRKLAAVAVAAALAAPIAANVAQADNTHGLCTAYFNGSENGRAHKRQAPPFVQLENTAVETYQEETGENPPSEEAAVEWYCTEYSEVEIGGTPEYGEDPEPTKGGNPNKGGGSYSPPSS